MATKTRYCEVEDCGKVANGQRGMCESHYRRALLSDPDRPLCEAKDCETPVWANSLCAVHNLCAAKLPLDHSDRPTCRVDGCNALVVIGDLRGGVCEQHGREKALSLPPNGTITDVVPHLQPVHSGGQGYMRVFCPWHPFADVYGYVIVHRLMAELLGLFDPFIAAGYAYADLDVHHKSRVRNDNSVSNLEAMLSGDHSRLTNAERLADKRAAEDLAITA